MIRFFRCSKITLTLTGISLIALLHAGCASKRYMNKALELEDAGLTTEAADLYLRSLQANNDNIDSKLGLKRTGQIVLDNKAKEFMSFFRNDQYKEAVYAFLEADKYRAQIAMFGIDLNLAENTRTYYQEVRDIYLNQQYGKAMTFLDAENFENALDIFTEILNIEPSYRDASNHWITARYEPVYRKGKAFLESEKYRSAYYAFDEIIKGTGAYKETANLQKTAREKALITIGIIPFSSSSLSQKNIADEICTCITSGINQQKSPFYEIIQSPSPEKYSDNYSVLRSILLKEETPHPTLPANLDAILSGKINEYVTSTSPLQKAKRKAWLKETKTIKEDDGTAREVTEFSKVYYYEYSRNSHFNLSFSYSLTNTHNHTIMVTDVIEKNLGDHIKYAVFDGDYKKLVPGTWYSLTKDSQLDKIFDDNQSIQELQSVFGERKDLNDAYHLKEQALAEISNNIALKIINYNPEI